MPNSTQDLTSTPGDCPSPGVAPVDPQTLSPEHADEPDSPCVAVCSTLFDDVCRGCGRTVMEVSNWVAMTAEEKRAVWARIRSEGYPRREG